MSATTDALRALIVDDATNDDRSLQVALGPSEIGNGCDRCLALLLSGEKPGERGIPWLPWIGRAVHERLDYLALRDLIRNPTSTRWITEAAVTVGTLRGQPVTGHADLYDTQQHEVVDYKIVGATTLTKVRRHGLPATYHRQVHLYGRGMVAAGHPVSAVTVWFLPRNAMSLDDGQVVTQPYDEQVALDALNRANMLAAGIDSAGIDTVLAATGPHTGAEFTCTKFGGNAPSEAVTGQQLDGLLAPTTPGHPVGSTAA